MTKVEIASPDDPLIVAVKELLNRHIAESRAALPDGDERSHRLNAAGNIVGVVLALVTEWRGEEEDGAMALAHGIANFFAPFICCQGHMALSISRIGAEAIRQAFEDMGAVDQPAGTKH